MNDTIFCGDNVEVLSTFDDECIDLTVTSPPYGTIRSYDGKLEWNFNEVAKQLYRVTKRGGVVVWVVGDQVKKGSESGESFRQALFFKSIGFNIHDTMIYQKHNPVPGAKRRYQQAFEFMFVFSKGRPKTFNCLLKPRSNECNDKRTQRIKTTARDYNGTFRAPHLIKFKDEVPRHNIWKYKIGGGNSTSDKIAYGHPAIFPEQLALDHILSWSNDGDVVLDPFCGSGTTLKMAQQCGRNFVGIDCNKKYCEISMQRVGKIEIVLPTLNH